MAKIYTPQPGTLPARVVSFFVANPGEEMTRDDIATKFEVRPGNIHTQLARCLEESLLTRTQNLDGEYIYRLGTKSCKPQGADIDAADKRYPLSAVLEPEPEPETEPETAAPPPTKLMFDGVTIDTDIPIPRGKVPKDWVPLLLQLKPGHSAKIALTDRYRLEKGIRAEHKGGRGKYTVRAYPDTKELRVWRVK